MRRRAHRRVPLGPRVGLVVVGPQVAQHRRRSAEPAGNALREVGSAVEEHAIHPGIVDHHRSPASRRLHSRMSVLPERSEEHTSELQSRLHLVCRLLLEKKKKHTYVKTLLESRMQEYYT